MFLSRQAFTIAVYSLQLQHGIVSEGGARVFDAERAVIARGGRLAELIVVRLNFGDDLLAALAGICQRAAIRNGVVLTGLGSLQRSAYYVLRKDSGYPPTDLYHERLEEPVEILNLNGIIADYEPHLHITLARREHSFGGHVEPGCIVHTLCEMTIGRLEGIELKRLPDPQVPWDMLQQLGVPLGKA